MKKHQAAQDENAVGFQLYSTEQEYWEEYDRLKKIQHATGRQAVYWRYIRIQAVGHKNFNNILGLRLLDNTFDMALVLMRPYQAR